MLEYFDKMIQLDTQLAMAAKMLDVLGHWHTPTKTPPRYSIMVLVTVDTHHVWWGLTVVLKAEQNEHLWGSCLNGQLFGLISSVNKCL